MEDYFIKNTSGELQTVIKTDLEKLKKVNEMHEAIDLFINGKKSKTMGYYSDDQMNAVEKMTSLLKEMKS